MLEIFWTFFYPALSVIGLILRYTWPLWLTLIVIQIAWSQFVYHNRTKFAHNITWTLLKITVPREQPKSLLAMELFLSTLHQAGGDGTWYDKNFLGKTRPWFSLEIASIGGMVNFYIRTQTGLKSWVIAQLYAQFPEAQVEEVEDYTNNIFFAPGKIAVWGANIVLKKDDTLPIKSYVDYGLDRDSKEEQRIDPIINMLEFLGSLKPTEQVWFQIIIRAHKGDWVDRAKTAVKDLVAKAQSKDGDQGAQRLTEGQKATISSIERGMSKLQFDVGMRGVYLAPVEAFSKPTVGGFNSSFIQYSAPNMNSFKPSGFLADFDHPWQDFKEHRQNKARRKVIEAYKLRLYFHPPYEYKPFVLTSEGLVTLFHFPGRGAQTPGLPRLQSRRGEAPPNLPM